MIVETIEWYRTEGRTKFFGFDGDYVCPLNVAEGCSKDKSSSYAEAKVYVYYGLLRADF